MNNQKIHAQNKADDKKYYTLTYDTYEQVEKSIGSRDPKKVFFKCETCNGLGTVRHEDFNPETTQYLDWEAECEECKGTGKIRGDKLLNKLA